MDLHCFDAIKVLKPSKCAKALKTLSPLPASLNEVAPPPSLGRKELSSFLIKKFFHLFGRIFGLGNATLHELLQGTLLLRQYFKENYMRREVRNYGNHYVVYLLYFGSKFAYRVNKTGLHLVLIIILFL